ncbi:MAG: EthD domain-containing protein [Alphaproteobacteria bacterium]|jgi:uncharacterized protein (TIGR02118 family)|nr:EthD domain-containing protein [Alphaproteobacteria bacterium]|tara:strand:+ start:170 stop:538 length:369 start_codon:yes stop_codon:yes gene_type:complete
MIKITFCLRRLAHLSRAEFQDYWLNNHGPLVRQQREALRFRRYVQLHAGFDELTARVSEARGAPPPYDGVAELWWQDIEDLTAATATKEGRAAGRLLLEDERKFIDLANSPIWFGEEHVIVG